MTKKPKRSRTLRREADRTEKKLLDARMALSRLEPGGSAEHPIEVSTASLVEPTARAMPCPACGGHVRVRDHTAETIAGRRLRVAKVDCARCGTEVSRYFTIAEPRLN
ncbi:MAG: hypothetical protein U0183_29380 [Polyangiaceae bacterium]